MKRFLPPFLADGVFWANALTLLGLAAIAGGVGLVYRPAGVIAAGLACLAVAFSMQAEIIKRFREGGR